MLIFDVIYVTLLVGTTVLLTLDLCEDDSTRLFVRDVETVQFISTRIMQCKYAQDSALHVVPWLFALVGPSTAFVFCTTLLKLLPTPHGWTDVVVGVGLMSMTFGATLIVRFDEVNLSKQYGDLVFEGFSADTRAWHCIGVTLLVMGIFALNAAILRKLLVLRFESVTMQTLLAEYEFFEIVYGVVLLLFVVTFAARQHFIAASLEYVLVGLVFVFVFLSRQLYYSLPALHSEASDDSTRLLEPGTSSKSLCSKAVTFIPNI